MVGTTPQAAARRRTHHHRHGPLSDVAPAQLGHLRDDVIEGCMHEVGELDFSYRPLALQGHADGDTHDRVFGQRRIYHALLAKFFDEPIRRAEDAAIDAYVQAHDEHALVTLHLMEHRLA